ncbi:DUF4365 domain-containing protein [Streptomyces sp. NPDC005955]|uniref:DUF4365 domain-containing protein n=1 Tax=Streptomyces sp. NPDC005955 TaxID=3364738 RepID=UPI0036BC5B60
MGRAHGARPTVSGSHPGGDGGVRPGPPVGQEIDGGNDYGEDCYLSFTERGERTGDLVAVQVKSGVEYRRSVGYAIPCRDHVEDWTRSRIPVIGVVYDPDLRKLFWVNLTRHLRGQLGRGKRPRSVPIAEDAVLDAGTLSSVVRCMREFIAQDDVRVAHERGLVSHLRSSLRSRGSRSFREVEDVPIGGKPFTIGEGMRPCHHSTAPLCGFPARTATARRRLARCCRQRPAAPPGAPGPHPHYLPRNRRGPAPGCSLVPPEPGRRTPSGGRPPRGPELRDPHRCHDSAGGRTPCPQRS